MVEIIFVLTLNYSVKKPILQSDFSCFTPIVDTMTLEEQEPQINDEIIFYDVLFLEDKIDTQEDVSEELDLECLETDYIVIEMVEEKVELIDTSNFSLQLPENYTKDDLRMLACMVFYENGQIQNDVTVIFNDDYDHPYTMSAHVMHQWTAQVCLNHLADARYPNSIYEDLNLPRYTSSYRTIAWAESAKQKYPELWEDCIIDCLMAMNGYVDLPSNVIFQSNYSQLGTHYANVYVDTGWFSSWTYFSIG